MKSMKRLSLSLLIAAAATVGSRGELLRTDINPALLYFQAYQLAPEFSPADRAYLEPVPEVPFVATFVATFIERIARFIGSSTKVATKMRILTGLG